MAKLLHEIEWGEPLLDLGPAKPEAMRGLSSWLASAAESLSERDKISYAPAHLVNIAYFVACQENECRFCYGMTRALLRIWGFSERQIQDLEHEAALADGVTRQVVEFSRKVAKSNPSPAKKDYEALLAGGLGGGAASEIAAFVAKACFANRLSTFLALPPDPIEKVPTRLLGRLFGFVVRNRTMARRVPPPEDFRNEGPCASIIAVAGRAPVALWLRSLVDGWLASEVTPRRCKKMMLAVIARQLGSDLCEAEARQDLADEGLAGDDVDAILSTLSSPRLTPLEGRLLRWTRETVWYEPRVIQESTRRLLQEIGERQVVDAVGGAAIANSLARLSLVRQ
jgi:alkylhydroperoxidase family enzyme